MRPRPRAPGPSSGSGTARLGELVESDRVGEALRVRDLPVHVAEMADAMPVDALAVKLIRHEPARHFGFAHVPEIVEAGADPGSIGGADEHVDVGSNAPRRIRVDVVGERRAFHQEHVEAAAAGRRDDALQLDPLRQLERDLTVGAGAQPFGERRRQVCRGAGRGDAGVQQAEDPFGCG